MRDMLDILRAAGWRAVLADLFGLACLCVTLYAVTVVAALVAE